MNFKDSGLDENNLNYLNEEISQYDILEDDSPRLKGDLYFNNSKHVENEYMNTYERHNYGIKSLRSDNNFTCRDNVNDSLKIKELEKINKNLKKTINYLQKKINQVEEQKTDCKLKAKRIGELEQENLDLNNEIEKMKGVLSMKEEMFQEFQNLVLVSNNKFKKLEDSNLNLLAEIDQLRKINEELKYRLNQYNLKELNYNSQLAEINELKDRINKLSDEKALELKLNEESIQKKIDEKENFLRQKYLKKEEQLKEELLSEVSGFQKEIERWKQDIERYRKENLSLQEKLESLESLMANKEQNTKKLLEHKDHEYEKILHLYKQSQNEKNNIEIHTNEKTTEYINNYNSMQDILKTLEKECEEKDKIINNLNEEIQNYKQSLTDIDLNFNEIKSQFERREKINEMLKNENMEIVREYNKLAGENEELKQSFQKTLNDHTELKDNFNNTSAKFNELSELYEDNVKQKEKENTNNAALEKINKELMNKIKIIEAHSNKETSSLRNIIFQKSEELEKVTEKYENKIILLKLKIEEQKYANDNLINEIANFREIVDNYENNFSESKLNSSKYNIMLDKYPVNSKNDGYQKQIINDLKNLITKMDVKISNTQNPTKNIKF